MLYYLVYCFCSLRYVLQSACLYMMQLRLSSQSITNITRTLTACIGDVVLDVWVPQQTEIALVSELRPMLTAATTELEVEQAKCVRMHEQVTTTHQLVNTMQQRLEEAQGEVDVVQVSPRTCQLTKCSQAAPEGRRYYRLWLMQSVAKWSCDVAALLRMVTSDGSGTSALVQIVHLSSDRTVICVILRPCIPALPSSE